MSERENKRKGDHEPSVAPSSWNKGPDRNESVEGFRVGVGYVAVVGSRVCCVVLRFLYLLLFKSYRGKTHVHHFAIFNDVFCLGDRVHMLVL